MFLTEVLQCRGESAIEPSCIVGDDDVVEDGVALDLPQVEADEAEVIVLVQVVVIDVLRVGDLLGLPEALVGRVGDSLHGPLSGPPRLPIRISHQKPEP